MLRIKCLVVVAVAALVPAGCTPKADKTITVSGTVNLDGQPMKDGEISFLGSDGGAPAVLPVRNGSFKGPVKPGKKRVEIRAYRDARADAGGGMYKGQPVPGASTKENYLPPRFNDATQLSAEVAENGTLSPNTFDVQSK